MRLDYYARSLVLAKNGERLLAATSKGCIHSLDVDSTGISLVSKQQISTGGTAITCIVMAPVPDGMPPLVVANCMDSTITVLQANRALTNFTVLKRLTNKHNLLPLRCCHVPGATDDIKREDSAGIGFIASGSEDGAVNVFDLDGFAEQKLMEHGCPVVDVAVSGLHGAGLMASGDIKGRIILWRRGRRTSSPGRT